MEPTFYQNHDTSHSHSHFVFEYIILNAPMLVVRIAPDGKVLFMNKMAEKLTGYALDEILGKNWWQIIYPNDLYSQVEKLFDEFVTKEVRDYRMTISTKGGRSKTISWSSVNLFNRAGEIEEIIGIGGDVTQQLDLEHELMLKKMALDSTNGGILISDARLPDNPIIYANPSFLKLSGYDALEVIGKNCRFLQGDDRNQPGRLEIRQALKEARPIKVELRNYRKDGTMFWNQIQISPVRLNDKEVTHFIGIQTDITERRQVLEKESYFSELSQRLAEALEVRGVIEEIITHCVGQLGDWCGIYLFEKDVEGKFSFTGKHVNPAHDDDLHYFGEELMNLPDNMIISPANVAQKMKPEIVFNNLEAELLKVGIDSSLHEMWKKIGSQAYMALPILARNRVIGVIIIGLSLGNRKLTEKEYDWAMELTHRASVYIENARLLEEVQNELRIREEFIAILSHDLKNPINFILLNAETYRKNKKAGKEMDLDKVLDRTKSAAFQMSEMINQLLDFLRLASNNVALNSDLVEVDSMIEESCNIFESTAMDSKISLKKYIIDPDLILLGDRERLMQVISNLLSNALKFTPEGGEVTIGARLLGEDICIFVRDTGVGIPKAVMSKVFQPYWQANPNLRSKGSLGLGLFIVQKIVRAHNGKIWVESEVGKVTTFYFSIPQTKLQD